MAAIIKEGIIAVGGMVDYTDFTSRGISAVVTDNASALKKAQSLFKNDYSTLITLPCLAHTLHLVIKEVLRYDPFTSVVDNCLKVTKYFLSNHHPKAILEKCMTASNVQFRKTLKIPGDTRWGSHFRMVDAVSNARLVFHNLVFIASEEVRERNAYPWDKTILSLLKSDEIWNDLPFSIES